MYILSYNLSWRSMKGDPSGRICNSINPNNDKYYGICQDNMITVIDKLPYKIIALQESSQYQDLLAKSANLKKMNYLAHQSGLDEMVTFYTPDWELLHYTVGEFEPGRPYQILYFKNFSFVNIHAGHYSKKGLNYKISQIIEKIPTKRIIIAGDFNNDLDNLEKIGKHKFHNAKNKINTCCYENYYLPFDHIIDTKAAPFISTVMEDNIVHKASDHLPIIGRIVV